MDSNKTECSFNKNGSCLYYYAIKATVKNTITKLEALRMKANNKDLFNELNEMLLILEDLGDRP